MAFPDKQKKESNIKVVYQGADPALPVLDGTSSTNPGRDELQPVLQSVLASLGG